MRVKYTLPIWPPSTNKLWRSFGGRNILSKEARVFYEAARIYLGQSRKGRTGAFGVLIELYPPNKRQYDVDNRLKAVLDVITKSNYWLDDNQVVELIARKHPFLETKKGEVEIQIWPIK